MREFQKVQIDFSLRKCCVDGLGTKKETVITYYQTDGVCGFLLVNTNKKNHVLSAMRILLLR